MLGGGWGGEEKDSEYASRAGQDNMSMLIPCYALDVKYNIKKKSQNTSSRASCHHLTAHRIYDTGHS